MVTGSKQLPGTEIWKADLPKLRIPDHRGNQGMPIFPDTRGRCMPELPQWSSFEIQYNSVSSWRLQAFSYQVRPMDALLSTQIYPSISMSMSKDRKFGIVLQLYMAIYSQDAHGYSYQLQRYADSLYPCQLQHLNMKVKIFGESIEKRKNLKNPFYSSTESTAKTTFESKEVKREGT